MLRNHDDNNEKDACMGTGVRAWLATRASASFSRLAERNGDWRSGSLPASLSAAAVTTRLGQFSRPQHVSG